jgi:deglycase
MAAQLRGKRIAVIATDGFEQSELTEPMKSLRDAGAIVDVVAPRPGAIQGMKHQAKGDKVSVDHTLDEARADEYSGLVTSRKPDDLPAFCREAIQQFRAAAT